MNKFFLATIFLLVVLVSVSQVSAVTNYLTWSDWSSTNRTFVQGTQINYLDTALTSTGNGVETNIFLIDSLANKRLLFSDVSQTSFHTSQMINTSSLTPGLYSIYATSEDLTTGFSVNKSLLFDLKPDLNRNHAPYFENLTQVYSYDLSLRQVDVVDLSKFAVDPDGDSLTFSLDTSLTNSSVVSCSLVSGSILNCNLNGLGSTMLGVIVSDGQLSTKANIMITVYHTDNNHPPYFDNSMNLFYSYDISKVTSADLVDLSKFGRDADDDALSYSLDTSMIDSSVASCYLKQTTNSDVLHCDLNGVGNTSFRAIVSDGKSSSSVKISLEVTNSTTKLNTAPYFVGLPIAYSYPLNMSTVDVVDLAAYAHDKELDTVHFLLDTSGTDSSIVSCYLVNNTNSVVPSTPYTSPSLLHCDLNGVGSTFARVGVSDGNLTTWVSLKISVYNSTPNHAPVFVGLKSYAYDIDQRFVAVLDLKDHTYDPDGDSLTFSLDQSSTNSSVVNCSLVRTSSSANNPSLVVCDLNNVGSTFLKLGVSDGKVRTWAVVSIGVYNNTVNHAPYFVNLSKDYYLDLSLKQADVVDLSEFAVDPDGDSLSFSLDTSLTNSSVVDCFLVEDSSSVSTPSVLVCDLNGVGSTSVMVAVSDGNAITWATININVYSSIDHAPFFNDSMPLNYTINLSQTSSRDLVDLAEYGLDVDGDVLSYGLGPNADSNIANCYLKNSSSVNTPNPFKNPALLHCDAFRTGVVSFNIFVDDGRLASDILLTLNVVNASTSGHVNNTNTTNSSEVVALITSPGTSSTEGEESFVDGSKSYSINSTIIDYDWLIKNIHGDLIYANNGSISSFYFNFTEGTYYINLTVTDAMGNSAHTSKIYKVYKPKSRHLVNGNKGLLILDYSIDGFDWERARVGGDLRITARVENTAAIDLKNVRLIFLAPNLGLEVKSGAETLRPGQIGYFTLNAYVPNDVQPDVYYPYIIASNNVAKRVKIGYLEVYE